MAKIIPKNLLNQSKFAELHHINKQKVAELLKQGDLLTSIIGKRTLIYDNKFNSDVVKDQILKNTNIFY
jgi:hypothetical protein